jgi:hypothetical protein
MKRAQMSEIEWAMVKKLKGASLQVASAGKRFIRILNPESRLSDDGRRFLAELFHRYRRQYKTTDEETLWLKEWADSARHRGSRGYDQTCCKLTEWEKLYGKSEAREAKETATK